MNTKTLCRVCNRPLTSPQSIARGVGPKCAKAKSSGGSHRQSSQSTPVKSRKPAPPPRRRSSSLSPRVATVSVDSQVGTERTVVRLVSLAGGEGGIVAKITVDGAYISFDVPRWVASEIVANSELYGSYTVQKAYNGKTAVFDKEGWPRDFTPSLLREAIPCVTQEWLWGKCEPVTHPRPLPHLPVFTHTGMLTPTITPIVKKHISHVEFHQRTQWLNRFATKAQEIAVFLSAAGWHSLVNDDWLAARYYADKVVMGASL